MLLEFCEKLVVVRRVVGWFCLLLGLCWLFLAPGWAAVAPKKPHVVVLGGGKQVPYSRAGDPAGAGADERALKVRPLLVDGRVSEWTTGEAHDVTDRSFVVRRALRVNDFLPGDGAKDVVDAKGVTGHPVGQHSAKQHAAGQHAADDWVWQRGPWLLVDRLTGHVAALKLPDYDPGVSQVAWFRDYGAYCGLTASGKSLYAVVAQLGARKKVLSKKLDGVTAGQGPVCGAVEWQREPLRVTFHPAGRDAASFDLAGGSAALVEDGDEEETKP